jgi:uncharacterized protein YcaQ
VLRQVAARGPLAARDLADGGKASGSWWGWSDGKRALEWLFWAGLVTTQARRGFERVYDLTERVLPEATACRPPTMPRRSAPARRRRPGARGRDAARPARLLAHRPDDASRPPPELVEAGDLLPARVEGWREPAFSPRCAAAAAARGGAVSPFDPLLWERDRAERLFGFRYRIEIYTPGAQARARLLRPALPAAGDRFARGANRRLDLKADRPFSTPRRTVISA